MALSTARRVYQLLAFAVCGSSAAGLLLYERLKDEAASAGRTPKALFEERILEAARTAKQRGVVASALLRTVLASGFDELSHRRFDSGAFNSSVAATVAELAASPPTRQELIYLGGGRLVDWLLQLAYPQQGEDSDWPYSSHDSGGLDSVDGDDAHGHATDGASQGPDDWDDMSSWFGSLPLPPAFRSLPTGGSGLFGGGGASGDGAGKSPADRSPPLPPLALPPLPLPGRRTAASGTSAGSGAGSSSGGGGLTGQPAPGGSTTQSPPGGHGDGQHLRVYDLQLAAALASAESQESQTAGSGGGAGAGAGLPSGGAHGSAQVSPADANAAAAAAAAATPSEPRPEAVLREDERRARRAERALEALLMDDGLCGVVLERPGAVPRLLRAAAVGAASEGVLAALARRAAEGRRAGDAMTADLRVAVELLRSRHAPAPLKRLAAGFCASWAAGAPTNRAKLTGLGLQQAVAEVATAVSGQGAARDVALLELQWELLRLSRVLADHSSSADAHHLACVVLPLLYTAADAAATADGAMAAAAVDTLAAAVRHGGAPVGEQVVSSTLPHLLWQLAKGLGAHRMAAAPPPPPPPAAAAGGAGAKGAAAAKGRGKAAGAGAEAGAGARKREGAGTDATAGGPAGALPKPPKRSAGGVVLVKDPVVVSSVAGAVGQLARQGLLPEPQVPRWRDWLLDVLTADPHTVVGQEAAGLAATTTAGGAAGGDTGGCGAAGPAGAEGVVLVGTVLEQEGQGRLRGMGTGGAGLGEDGAMEELRGSVVDALAALSQVPGNQGLQAAHYWLSRLLSELAARTLPYTSLVYTREGPRDPNELVHAVPVLPSYVKAVSEALERAADAVAADDSMAVPLALEFELAGSGLVGPRPLQTTQKKKSTEQQQQQQQHKQKQAGKQQQRPAAASTSQVLLEEGEDVLQEAGGLLSYDEEHGAAGGSANGPAPLSRRTAGGGAGGAAVDAASGGRPGGGDEAYRAAAHVVDVVVAERKAADALEALCAIVAPDPAKQRWLLQRGVLPLMHRLTRTADDPRVGLPEQGGPGTERTEAQLEAVEAAAAARAAGASLAAAMGTPTAAAAGAVQPKGVAVTVQQGQQPVVVVSELMSDHEGGPSLCLQRQVARMLAMLALLPEAQQGLVYGTGGGGGTGGGAADGTWLAWLRHAALSTDCRLSSNATRALLHVDAMNVVAEAAASRMEWAGVEAEAAQPPVFHDGVHLLDPVAGHHWALVRRATASLPATGAAAAAAAVPAAPGLASAADGVTPSRVGGTTQGEPAPRGTGQPTAVPPSAAALMVRSVAHGKAACGSAELQSVTHVPTPPAAAPSSPGRGSAQPQPLPATPAGHGPSPTASALAAAHLASTGAGGGAAAAAPLYGTLLPYAQALTHNLSSAVFSVSTALTYPLSILTSPQPHSSPTPLADASPYPPLPPASTHSPSPASSPTPSSPFTHTYQPEPDAPETISTPTQPPATASTSTPTATVTDPTEPLVDVVFIHGIRGGPFITWRKAGVMTRGSAASHMERNACWPSTWLAEDFPRARLLSVEYLAPVSAWEGESLPLEDNVSRVMGQLAAAGVGCGARPVVFVAHSMGGLLVKEMLARSMEQAQSGGGPHARLASSTRGVVFYATPHFGNGIAALGWKLRYLPGALPAPSLARLTPGPHLLALNEALQKLYEQSRGSLRVVSLLEGQPTQLSGVIPRILIVAPDSAYPGFGEGLTLLQQDHIDICKPASKTAPAYTVVRDVLRHAMRQAVRMAEEEGAGAGG